MAVMYDADSKGAQDGTIDKKHDIPLEPPTAGSSSRLIQLAGPSDGEELPSFEQSTSDALVDLNTNLVIPDGGEAPPPSFTPYEAEYTVAWDKSIVSHDPHLNRDGEALYRFLLARAQEAPDFVLHVVGSHTETRYRTVTSTDSRGRTTTREERDVNTVTDFDYRIDVGQHLLPRAHLWTVADSEPAYRGGTKRCVKDGPPVSRSEGKAARKLRTFRERVGFPPWIGSIERDQRTGKYIDPEAQLWEADATGYATFSVTGTEGLDVLASSWTLRQWADDYAASDKIFKEFIFEKVVFGWQTGVLVNAVRAAVLSTGFTGDLNVQFEKSLARVVIRPDTRFQRLLSKQWFRILAWITLIYPIVWLFQQFHPRGLGRWTVAGSAHALHRHQSRAIATDNGGRVWEAYNEGLREGEWFKAWEGTIRKMAKARVQSSTALQVPDDTHARRLDGYSRRGRLN